MRVSRKQATSGGEHFTGESRLRQSSNLGKHSVNRVAILHVQLIRSCVEIQHVPIVQETNAPRIYAHASTENVHDLREQAS